MPTSLIADHSSRLAAFGIGSLEIAALQRQHDRVVLRLPDILDRLDQSSNTRLDAVAAFTFQDLRQQRDAYWHCIASGQLGETFVEAAAAFATKAYAKGIVSREFTIRHSAGARMLVDGLFGKSGSSSGTSWAARIVRLQFGAKHRAQYAGALQKALWLGLSIVLEAYALVEAKEKLAAIRKIEHSFSERVSSIADVLADQVIALNGAVVSISASAKQSTASVELLADDALTASMAVRTVSASTDELARTVSYIGEHIAQCAQSAADAAAQAMLGDSAVAKFAETTTTIDQITLLINQIADRTKLLALNATIEAARAGLFGRGFAVVASEVTNLAKETSAAVARVSQQVRLIRGSAQESSTAIHALAGRIGEVSAITSVIASSVLEQGTVTQDIAASVKHAAVGNDQVAQLMTSMKLEAGRSLDLAGILATAAAGIGLQGNMVRDITQTFMSDVYTAQQTRTAAISNRDRRA